MAKKNTSTALAEIRTGSGETTNLNLLAPEQRGLAGFAVWIVGDTPLLVHSWSEKARRAMLDKQRKQTRPGEEAREPIEDFVSSLYLIEGVAKKPAASLAVVNGKRKAARPLSVVPDNPDDWLPADGVYGFPATGVKKCLVAGAHKKKGVNRTDMLAEIWLNAEWVRTRPALAGAVCDMPLIRIHGSRPEMREDMVRIGTGLRKTATLAYRGQFSVWAMLITGEINTSVITAQQLLFGLNSSGRGCGIGEWRNEKNGMFGSFHVANIQEAEAWQAFADGQGPLPQPAFRRAA
jgi:hypothetical protein